MRRLAIIAACALLLAGCAARRETVVEHVPVVLHDTLTRVERRLDSVRVLERVERAGDTVHHWHDVYRERRTTDTLLRTRTDTATITRTITLSERVERSPRWWETALQWAGGITVAACAAWLLIRLRR